MFGILFGVFWACRAMMRVTGYLEVRQNRIPSSTQTHPASHRLSASLFPQTYHLESHVRHHSAVHIWRKTHIRGTIRISFASHWITCCHRFAVHIWCKHIYEAQFESLLPRLDQFCIILNHTLASFCGPYMTHTHIRGVISISFAKAD